MQLDISNWNYVNGQPLFSGHIKKQLSDFKVFEKLSFEPSGSGEHTFLKIEKTGLNTAFLAEQLAQFAKLPLKAVSYAGRKDKYAQTTQWFSVYYGNKAGQTHANWNDFKLEGAQILKQVQNDKKLRHSAMKENGFEIIIRLDNPPNSDLLEEISTRIDSIVKNGVPNYFGLQRFGEQIKNDGSKHLGGNLNLAIKMVNGEIIKNRNKRSMAISALRSWLFNEFVSQRIQDYGSSTVLLGDALSLSGSNSFFVYSNEKEHENIVQRLKDRDIMLTSPLWGNGELQSTLNAGSYERKIAEKYSDVTRTLAELGLAQERRPLMLFPKKLKYSYDQDGLKISFYLPSGSYATSVIREIANCDN